MSGCDLWLDVDKVQCKTADSCVALLGDGATCGSGGVCIRAPASPDAGAATGSPLPERWACVRDEPRAATPDPETTLRVRMDAVDITSLRVPPGLTAAACLSSDASCERPLLVGAVPGGDGFLELGLPLGFEGFIKLDAPDYVPALTYDSRPYLENMMTHGPPLLTPSVLNLVASHSGKGEIDPNLGMAFLEIRDCVDIAPDGVVFANVGDNKPFYFEGQFPEPDLQMTAISNQLSAGREARAVGGFINLLPGSTTFLATLAGTDEILSYVTVQIVPGHITYVRMRAGY